jgi:peptidyl-tRNA hydrolase
MSNKKLFVIVRRDLTPAQQAVQAGHAVAEYLLSFYSSREEWRNGTLVYLGVKNEKELEKWIFRLHLKEAPCVVFMEPDLNDEKTAIASIYDESFFRNLQVL